MVIGRPSTVGPATTMSSLRTQAWLLLGLVSSIPGELILRDRAISFVTRGSGSAWPRQLRRLERMLAVPGLARQIEDEASTTVFQWRIDEVTVRLPWYYWASPVSPDTVLS